MAVDGFNANTGGVMGVKVEALAADDQGNTASLAQKLATDRAVLGVVGPMDSGSALRAGPALDAGHLAFISQSASS
ncbi:MAG: ABC transporter substrate-binding protein, partial [Chloroflexota bacterium]